MESIFQYYIEQSITSKPYEYATLFNDLPTEVEELSAIIKKLFFHVADEELYGFKVPMGRLAELDTRYVSKIMALIMNKSQESLVAERKMEKRVIGICRDMALLMCSVLRYKGIPARVRVGFADYFSPGIFLDGIWLEFWNQQKQKWCISDVRTTETHIHKLKLKIDFDLFDIPKDRFIAAEYAWKLCRSGEILPKNIGARNIRGLWYVRNRLIQSLAMMNKQEVLLWDAWRLMLAWENGKPVVPDAQLSQMDCLSDFLIDNAYTLHKLTTYYSKNECFQVPEKVMSFNPFLGTCKKCKLVV